MSQARRKRHFARSERQGVEEDKALACIQALYQPSEANVAFCTKREKSAKRKTREGDKKWSACYQSIVLVLPTFTTWTSRSNWLIDDALLWRDSGMFVWNKMAVTQLCFLTKLLWKVLRLLPNVPEINEKRKECLNCLLRFSKPSEFWSSKANFAAVNHLSGPRRKQKITSTGSKGHGLWLADFDPFGVSLF